MIKQTRAAVITETNPGYIAGMKFISTRDKSYLITCNTDGSLTCRDTSSLDAKAVKNINTGLRSLYQIAVSSNADLIAVSAAEYVHLYNFPDLELYRKFHFSPEEKYQSVCFSPDDKLLFITGNREILRVVEVNEGKVVQEYRAGERTPCMVIHPSGSPVAVFNCFQGGSRIMFGEVSDGTINFSNNRNISNPCDALTPGAFSDDGHHFAFADKNLKVYRFPSLEPEHCFDYYGERLSAPEKALFTQAYWSNVVFTSDSAEVFCGSPLGQIFRWDVSTGNLTESYQKHLSGIISIDINDDRTLMASSSYDRKLILWEI